MEEKIKYHFLNEQQLPLVVESLDENLTLETFIQAHKSELLQKLDQYGALLFRNFYYASIQDFENGVQAIDPQTLSYEFRSTPRTQVKGNLLTSTEYPAKETIPMHNEIAYRTRWPMKLWFYCQTPSETGGETPLVDSRKMFQALDPAIIERFEKDQLLYVRNYHSFLDLSWQDVFQTTDKSEVEAFCRQAGIDFEWMTENHLRTKNKSQASAVHPRTNEKVWFNQAHLFHVSSLTASAQEALVSSFGMKNLPRNAFYGDKTPIENEVLDKIRAQYEALKIAFPWQKNDALLVDNMLVAHGRHPYTGDRKVIVAMSEEYEAISVS